MLLEHNKNGNLYRINLQKTDVKYAAFTIKLITNTFGVYFLRGRVLIEFLYIIFFLRFKYLYFQFQFFYQLIFFIV